MLRYFPFFLILYEFCTNMSNDMYVPALAIISEEFWLPINNIQQTIAAWLAGASSVQLMIGSLSDRFGRRPVLFIGGLIFLVSTLGCGLSVNLSSLLVFRFFQGIGVCTMMVAGYASIHDTYPDKKAIPILAWMGSAAVIAPAIGPVLGGLLLMITSWRMTFYVLFILGTVSLLGLWFSMPEKKGPLHPLNIKTILQRYKRIISQEAFITSSFSYGLLYAGVIGWITASPFLLMQHLHLSPAQFGAWQIPIFGSYIIGASLVKPLLNKIGKENLISSGLILSSIAALSLIIFAILNDTNLFSFVIPMIGYSIGFGMASSPLNRTAMTSTKEEKGSSMAIFYLIMEVSGTLISFCISLFNERVILGTFAIGIAIWVAFVLNTLRRAKTA